MKDSVNYNYQYNAARARARQVLNALWPTARGNNPNVMSTIEQEAEIIWQQSPVMIIDCNRHGVRDAVQRMFAALFYVQIDSVSSMPSPRFCCSLVVKCRLAYGPHRTAVIRTLSEYSISVSCEVAGTEHRSTLCSPDVWQSFSASAEKEFAHAISITAHSLEDVVRVRIDGVFGDRVALDIGNSPSCLCHLLDKQHSYGTINADDGWDGDTTKVRVHRDNEFTMKLDNKNEVDRDTESKMNSATEMKLGSDTETEVDSATEIEVDSECAETDSDYENEVDSSPTSKVNSDAETVVVGLEDDIDNLAAEIRLLLKQG